MKKHNKHLSRSAIAMAVLGCLAALQASNVQAAGPQLPFSDAPATNTFTPPAPNVIIAVDDSGSMSTVDRGATATRMANLQASLRQVFNPNTGVVPDSSIRLGWSALNGCSPRGCPRPLGTLQGVRVLDTSTRTSFLNWVNNLTPSGWTPTQQQMWNVGQYYRTAEPWDAVPGTNNPNPDGQQPLACRRSYLILLSDGDWNNSQTLSTGAIALAARTANGGDGVPATLPDGVRYDPAATSSRIYADRATPRRENGQTQMDNTIVPTLADMAFHFWSSDLRPLPNEVPALYDVNDVNISGVNVPRYWNPRNNPATWQHMTTYTIGYGPGAATWNVNPVYDGATNWEGNSYTSLWQGSMTWPVGNIAGVSRRPDMWHAALNSRGEFVPVLQPGDLAPAFERILSKIQRDSSLPPVTSMAGSARSSRFESMAFSGGYEPAHWNGYVKAYKVTGGVLDTDSAWTGGSSAEIMDAKTNAWAISTRKVFTSSAVSDNLAVGGLAFRWPLTGAHLNAVRAAGSAAEPAARTQARVNFLRGDRTNEDGNIFRERASRHGDVVNSEVWYQRGVSYGSKIRDTRPSVVYVGANDGMLHAFSTGDTNGTDSSGAGGEELFAYIPKGVLPHVKSLADPSYRHRYFVDGSPFTGEVEIKGAWKTVLVGTLGAGGRGYFMLDVTKPATFAANDVLVDVTMDSGSAGDTANANAYVNYLGHIFSSPVLDQVSGKQTQLTKMNNGEWAYVTGNGYNSVNGVPALVVHFLTDVARPPKVIPVPVTGAAVPGNGLSAPRLVDTTGDGIPEVAYAGDLAGNLWKFDLSSTSPSSSWNASVANNRPLFTGVANAGGIPQHPITAAPGFVFVNRNDFQPCDSSKAEAMQNGILLTFGTGQNLTNADRGNTTAQRLYSVMDRTEETGADWAVQAADLVELKITQGSGSGGNTLTYIAPETVDYTDKRGWFVEMTTNTANNWLAKSRFLQNVQPVSTGAAYVFRANLEVPAFDTGTTDHETCSVSMVNSKHYSFIYDVRSIRPTASSCSAGGFDSVTPPTDGMGLIMEDPGAGVSVQFNDAGQATCITDPSLPGCLPDPNASVTGVAPTWRGVR